MFRCTLQEEYVEKQLLNVKHREIKKKQKQKHSALTFDFTETLGISFTNS